MNGATQPKPNRITKVGYKKLILEKYQVINPCQIHLPHITILLLVF